MKKEVIQNGANEKEIMLSKKTMEILEKAKKNFGLEECYEELKNYAIYLKMKKIGKVDFGSYNVLIINNSEYKKTDKIVEIIAELLEENEIIKTDYQYLERNEIEDKKNKKSEKGIKDLIVLDSKVLERDLESEENEIIKYMEKNKNKVFILIDNDIGRFKIWGRVNAKYFGKTAWEINLNQFSEKEKEKYIMDELVKNKIKIDEKSNFLEVIKKEPLWQINKVIKECILYCKLNNIKKVTDTNLKKELKEQYLEKKANVKENCKIEKMENLIGMQEVKEQVEKIINFVKINKERKNLPALHMVFTGNPGTGKTTIARIIGQAFCEMNILSKKGNFVEVHGRDLVAKFVGWTADETKSLINKAEGGVLFIDEAYSLNSDRRGSFEDEAIATLIKEMEDKRDRICVILAGYENEMAELIKRNPGFESRIPFKIHFPDYSEEELYEIFKVMAKSENYKISNGVKKIIMEYFEEEKNKENFSNAREVRNIFEKVKFEQASRVVKNSNENMNTIKKEDLLCITQITQKKEVQKRKIGFTV